MEEVIYHPDYKLGYKGPAWGPFDVALLRLAKRVDLKKFPPVCLPKSDEDFVSKQGHVYGKYN